MAQLVLGVAGAVIGGMFGMPSVGWAIGSAVGSAFAPTQKSHGPKLSDLKVTASEYGGALHILEGHPRVAGVVAWSSDKHEIATTTEQGKGGGAESTSYTYECDCFMLLSDAEILGIRRIWSNGKLIWSIADDSDEETIEASEDTTKWKAMRMYSGAADQLPDPVYEAAVGVGNAPAYRGRGGVFFEGLSLGSGGVMPNLTFEVNAEISEGMGPTRLVTSQWAPVDRRHSPVLGAGVPGVKMTTIHKGQVKTWSTEPGVDPVIAMPPENAEVREPGMCNGDRPIMVFGFFGGADIDIWSGFSVAGDGVSTNIAFPSAYKYESLGTDDVRASTWLGKIAVSSASPLGEPGVKMTNQGAIWLYTLTGDYLGRIAAGEPVKSLALTSGVIYAAVDSGVRVFDIDTLAESEISPIAYPAGTSGHRIFVGGGGVLCCATAALLGKTYIYIWFEDAWVLDKTIELPSNPDVDTGTTSAHHFRAENGDVYTVVPDPIYGGTIPEWFGWVATYNYSTGPYTSNVLDASSGIDRYVFSKNNIINNGLTEVSDPRYEYEQDSYEEYSVPIRISVGVDVSAAYVVGIATVLASVYCRNVSGYFIREGARDNIARIKFIDYQPEVIHAHAVYITPTDLAGTLVNANLKDVVERLCFRTGLAGADVDATELASDWVYAFAIPPGPAKAALDQLATAYYFECVESDKLYFRKRGRFQALTIPYDNVGAESLLAVQDANDLEVSAQVFVKYMNLDDSYQSGSEVSDRLTTDSTAISNMELALGFTPAQAKGIADTACLDQNIGSRSLSFSVDRRYSELEPTDVVGVQDGFGSTFRARIVKISDASGVRSIEAVADDASVLSATGLTSNNYTPDYTVRPVALTDLVLLDIPILRDVDDGPGVYAAGDGLAGTWAGYALFIEGLQVGTSTTGAAMGATIDVLGTWASGLVDETNSVTVQLNPGDQLASITHDQLTSSIRNYAAIGAHGRWELLQYRSAELIGTGTYRLRGLLRGQLGSEHLTGTHQAGDRFVALDGAGMLRPAASIADIMTPRDYQGVTIGSLVSTAPVQSITNTGVGMRPYAPVNLRQHKAGADIAMAWDRRTRYQTNLLTDVVPLGEAAEQYQVDVMNGPTVVRTLTTSTPSVTYTAAQQTADFGAPQAAVDVRVYQISATVGRGTPLIYEA